jgi:pimeloyl-ACP methyl ester carboxylesterase
VQVRWQLLASLVLLPIELAAQAPLPRRPLFGVSLATLSDSARTALKVPSGNNGIVIQSVVPGGTAAAMGLEVGDVIVSMNNQLTPATPEFLALLRGLGGGATVEVKGFRAGAPLARRGVLQGKPLERTALWETVASEVTVAGRRRRVLITKPLTPGRHPTLFVIGGIGAFTFDGPMETIPYSQIFRRFADAGWVTVRVDKPGQGDSEGGDISELRFDDELAGYRATLALTLQQPYVDTSRVVIFGHSMGGSHGAVLAGESNQIAGVAASATIGVTFIEYWLTNLRRQFELGGASSADADRVIKAMAQVMPLVMEGGMDPLEVARSRPALAEAVQAGFSPDGKTLSGMSVPFWRELNAHNMGSYWGRTTAKVLALAGETDFVATREDMPRIAAAVNAAHPGNGRFVLLPETDHFLQRRATYAESFAKMGKEPGVFNPMIVDTLFAWASGVRRTP